MADRLAFYKRIRIRKNVGNGDYRGAVQGGVVHLAADFDFQIGEPAMPNSPFSNSPLCMMPAPMPCPLDINAALFMRRPDFRGE